MLAAFWNIVLMPLFPLFYLYSCSPHPLHIGMLFPTVFCCCHLLILREVDMMLFYYFFYYL